MFTITTATGKKFDSDYAVENTNFDLAFVSILGKSRDEVEAVFKNAEELPLDCFPEYKTLGGFLDAGTATKLLLKKGVRP